MKILTLDLGGTFLKAAIMDDEGKVSEKWKVPSGAVSNEEDLMKIFDAAITGHTDDVKGIALSMPGKIDAKEKIAHTTGAFQLKEVPIGKLIEERYGLPMSVNNDGKCAASAELWKGALKGVTNGMVYVIGTGLGGGLVIDGKVYFGSHYTAAEISCPLVTIREGVNMHNSSAGAMATNGLINIYRTKANIEEPMDGIAYFEKVNSGDPLAMEALEDWCQLTVHYMFNLQIVLDLEKIAIGGGISAQPILVEKLREAMDTFYETTCYYPWSKPEIVVCQYENDANLLGALKFFLDEH